MADFLSDVAEYLADQGLGFSSGPDISIFVGKHPSDPNNCVSILGLLGGETPDPHIRDFIYPRFQIVVRNDDYETGATKYLAVRNALHARIGLTFDNFHVLRCHAIGDGGSIGEDDQGRAEFACNFTAQARET